MDRRFFDEKYVNIKDIENKKIEVQENSFLLLSSHRNDYFKEFNEKLSDKNPNYQGYILKDLFFSQGNIEIIQRQLVLSIYKASNKKYVIPFQSYESIITVMKYMFFSHSKNLPYDITKQIKELNDYAVKDLTPMILKNIERRETYIKEINSPPPVNPLPTNVNSAGNRTLPSYTSTIN